MLKWDKISKTYVSKYKAGQSVLALDTNASPPVWRKAMVEKPEPYPGADCDGARILWKDLPTPCPSWISVGGWKPENCLKEEEKASLAPVYPISYLATVQVEELQGDYGRACPECSAQGQHYAVCSQSE